MPIGDVRINLSYMERRMFEAVERAGTVGITMPELLALMYGDREDGGPLQADASLRTRAYQLRKRLKPWGLTVKSKGGPYARYFLKRLDET